MYEAGNIRAMQCDFCGKVEKPEGEDGDTGWLLVRNISRITNVGGKVKRQALTPDPKRKPMAVCPECAAIGVFFEKGKAAALACEYGEPHREKNSPE